MVTKSDEIYVNYHGRNIVDGAQLDELLLKNQFDELYMYWQRLQREDTVFRIFCTTAISNSELDNATNLRTARRGGKLFPTGCASPFYWLASQCLQRNGTLLSEWREWFQGTSPKALTRLADGGGATADGRKYQSSGSRLSLWPPGRYGGSVSGR